MRPQGAMMLVLGIGAAAVGACEPGANRAPGETPAPTAVADAPRRAAGGSEVPARAR